MSYQRERRQIQLGRWGAEDVAGAAKVLQRCLRDERSDSALAAFARVSQFNLDAGFGRTLAALGTVDGMGMAEATAALAARARADAFGISGMRVAAALTDLAAACEGRDYLTAVELARFLDEQFGMRVIASNLLDDSRSVPAVWRSTFSELSARVAISEQGREELDASNPAFLDPAVVAFFLLSACCYLGLGDAEHSDEVRDVLDYTISELPRVSAPTPPTWREQRQSFALLRLVGPPGTLANFERAARSKDPIVAAGGADPFGWEEWRILQRASEPTIEVPGIAGFEDVVVLSPGPPLPPQRPAASNVVMLDRPRHLEKPAVLALTRSVDVLRELAAMGVNAVLNPRDPSVTQTLVERCGARALTVLTADEHAAQIARSLVDGPIPLVHGQATNELELLAAAIKVCAPVFTSNSDETLNAAHDALGRARDRFWQVEVTAPHQLSEHAGALEALAEQHPGGALRVLLPANCGQAAAVEAALPRALTLQSPVEFFNGDRLAMSYTW